MSAEDARARSRLVLNLNIGEKVTFTDSRGNEVGSIAIKRARSSRVAVVFEMAKDIKIDRLQREKPDTEEAAAPSVERRPPIVVPSRKI